MKYIYRIFLTASKSQTQRTVANAPIKIKAFLTTKKGKLVVKYYPMSKQVYNQGKICYLKDFINQGYIDMEPNDFILTRGSFTAFMWDEFSTMQIKPIEQ